MPSVYTLMNAYTNVKTTIKNPKTGEEHMTHHPIKSEITYPASGRVEKTKST
jgi:hypothetical protein